MLKKKQAQKSSFSLALAGVFRCLLPLNMLLVFPASARCEPSIDQFQLVNPASSSGLLGRNTAGMFVNTRPSGCWEAERATLLVFHLDFFNRWQCDQ